MNINIDLVLWVVFAVLMTAFFILDLGILNKTPKKLSTRSALLQAGSWVMIAVAFGFFIYYFYEPPQIPKMPVITRQDAAFQYFTAYVTEYALSVDNIFVIIIILRYFHVEEKYHHKVLFWGILGALVMRGIFIFLGATLIHQFHWILYFFGAFLLYTGIKMLVVKDDDDVNVNDSSVIKLARKYLNFTQDYHGEKFYIRQNGVLYFTPLFLVIILIESTDLIFAIDSIPAVFSITQDEFILYTSNIFAIMGLRAMFFLLSGILDKFYLLKKGLSLVLMFIGFKMMLHMFEDIGQMLNSPFIASLDNFKISTQLSLIIILSLLAGSIVLSLLIPRKKEQEISENVQPSESPVKK